MRWSCGRWDKMCYIFFGSLTVHRNKVTVRLKFSRRSNYHWQYSEKKFQTQISVIISPLSIVVIFLYMFIIKMIWWADKNYGLSHIFSFIKKVFIPHLLFFYSVVIFFVSYYVLIFKVHDDVKKYRDKTFSSKSM